MALPVQRTNLVTNPSPAVGTGWSVSYGTTGAGTVTYGTVANLPSKRGATVTWTTAPTAGWSVQATRYAGVTAGQSFVVAMTGRHSWAGGQAGITVQFFDAANASLGYFSAARQTIAANTTTTLSFSTVAPAGATQFGVFWDAQGGTLPPVNGTAIIGAAFGEKATAFSDYWDGDTIDPSWTYKWTGTVNASTSTKDYYGVWVEQVAGAGAPRVQVTAIGLGTTAKVTKVTRKAGREVWTVPGWRARNTIGGDTATDFTPPLGVPVTYSLFVAGQAVSNMTITITSTTGWIQDPLNPETALPIALNGNDKNTLGLAKPALKRVKYGARYEEEYAMGSRYPVVRASARGGAEDVEVIINAQTNAMSDSLLALIEQAPIILFRPLPSWGSLPPLAYTVGDVEESPINRDRGGGFTQWLTGGKLVAPVSRGPVKGQITHQMVQDNLVGRTHASIQASSGNKRHIEIQANPLGLGQ